MKVRTRPNKTSNGHLAASLLDGLRNASDDLAAPPALCCINTYEHIDSGAGVEALAIPEIDGCGVSVRFRGRALVAFLSLPLVQAKVFAAVIERELSLLERHGLNDFAVERWQIEWARKPAVWNPVPLDSLRSLKVQARWSDGPVGLFVIAQTGDCNRLTCCLSYERAAALLYDLQRAIAIGEVRR